MSSYFVASAGDGAIAVHDRSRCAPAVFRPGAEYLGEFTDAAQAIAVARLRYAHAQRCPCCASSAAPGAAVFAASSLVSAPSLDRS